MLFYVLKIFQLTYAELRIFFMVREKDYKKKILRFFHIVFKKSLSLYDEKDTRELSLVKPRVYDYFFVFFQIVSFSLIFILKRISIQSGF